MDIDSMTPDELRRRLREALMEVERLKKAMEERWFECHDGSEQACSKSHED